MQALVGSSRDQVPHCCVDCVFWQRRDVVADPGAKADWARDIEDEFGAWDRVIHDGADARGLVQYGPSRYFANAWALPAGPPDRRSVLITCAYVCSDDPRGIVERLLLEALADVQARGLGLVEAFALEPSAPQGSSTCREHHHTLFDAEVLRRLGFRAVRSVGAVSLMRLQLDAAIPVEHEARIRRLLRHVRPSPVVRPEPV